MFADKIGRVLNEIAKDDEDFESSYVDLSRGKPKPNPSRNVEHSAQVHEQSLMLSDKSAKPSSGKDHREQPPQPTTQVPQPFVMPIIINPDHYGRQSHSGFGDLNQLRDIINQAVSSQLQLHAIRKEHNLIDDNMNPVDDSLRSEEAKLNCENQLLHKQIPINVNPHMLTQFDRGYQNPFSFGSARPTIGSVQPPLIVNDLISDDSSDLYSDTRSPGKRPYQRSEGEVGQLSAEKGRSAGEVRPGTGGRNKTLGQTYNYDEDRNVNEPEPKPVYDSSEGPFKKGGKPVQGKSKADVFISGDSFGGKGFKAKPVGGRQVKRDTIGENFLEEEDESLAESGEIDPRMFR